MPEPEPAKEPKPRREPKPAARHEVAAIAFVRELRDRYLEGVNKGDYALPEAGKYAVGLLAAHRQNEREPRRLPAPPLRQLPAAA